MTDGSLIMIMIWNPLLKGYDGIIIDEAHERKIQIDFLLYLLKKTLEKRPKFKLIIMSATVNEKVFIEYFKNFDCKNIELSGETNYSIEWIFLKKSIWNYIEYGLELIKNLVKDKKNKGDIIFFVWKIWETEILCEKIAEKK